MEVCFKRNEQKDSVYIECPVAGLGGARRAAAEHFAQHARNCVVLMISADSEGEVLRFHRSGVSRISPPT